MGKGIFINIIAITFCILQHNTFGQKQNINSFKIKKETPRIYVVGIDSNYWDNSTSKAELLDCGRIELLGDYEDTIKITGFNLSIGVNGTFYELASKSDSITVPMREKINAAMEGSYVIIKYVSCQTKSG